MQKLIFLLTRPCHKIERKLGKCKNVKTYDITTEKKLRIRQLTIVKLWTMKSEITRLLNLTENCGAG